MMLIFLLFSWQGSNQAVETVRAAYLDIDERYTVGKAWEAYSWFKSFDWTQTPGDGHTVVTFKGLVDDEEAVRYFEEHHKYKWPTSLHAMQLAPAYQLDGDKDQLSFTFKFQVEPDESLRIISGELGIRSKDTGDWKQVSLTNKAIGAVIKGFYLKRDPYLSLIKGLPYK